MLFILLLLLFCCAVYIELVEARSRNLRMSDFIQKNEVEKEKIKLVINDYKKSFNSDSNVNSSEYDDKIIY